MKTCLVKVYAGYNDDGPAYEELPAQQVGSQTYELLTSPGLTLNLARGDWVKTPEGDAPAEVIKRGGNFCIQIYADHIDQAIVQNLEKGVQIDLSGSLDGINGGNLSLSVPASNGTDKIRNFFDRFTQETGITWYYGNIYKTSKIPTMKPCSIGG